MATGHTRSMMLATAILATAGCAPAPQYSATSADPFRGSLNSSRVYANARACFIVTDNTLKTVQYLDSLNSGFIGASGTMAGFDSRRVISEFSSALQSRFRDVIRIDSVTDMQPRGCDMALAADLKVASIPSVAIKTASASITVSFANAQGVRLDTIDAQSKGEDWNSLGGAFSKAWTDALEGFISRIDSSKPLLTFINSLPGYSVANAPATNSNGNGVELAFWESVKDSRSPGDFRAYLDKFPSGSFASLARARIIALGEPVPAATRPLGLATAGRQNFGNYFALVIGIDNYRNVTPLKTAVNDARAVADLLRSSYGFSVTTLLDPTRNQMLDAFDDLRRKLTDSDNLVIYYAGHGYLDVDSDRGFWLPVDADANRRANWLSNSDIADMVRAARAKHVMVVADSCYAGTLTRNLSVETSGLDDLSRLAQKRARTALTSGGLEPVEDAGGKGHSVFAAAFLDALQSNTGVADMSALFSSIRRKVLVASQQTPQYGDIRQTGHEGGDFIFVKQR